MKIALISEWVDAWRGGAERSTLQFLHHLLAEGVEVHLFTRSRPAAVPGLIVRNIGGASMSRTRSSMTFAHRVERVLCSERFDVRHAITPCRHVDLYQPRGGTVAESIERNLATIESPALRGIKSIANYVNVKQRHALRLERSIIGDADGPVIVAISDYVVRQLKQHYNLPDARIRKVFNGVDLTPRSSEERVAIRHRVRAEFGLRENDLLVLLVAHNFRLKGVGRWMQALSWLIRQGVTDVHSLVVGKGDHPGWHRYAAALGLNQRLRFVGASDRVPDLYAAADLLIHPTYYDPCSRVILEAMAAGLPCIASRWDGAAELMTDGVDGFVLSDPADREAIVRCVTELRDARKRQDFASRASRIIGRIGMDRHARTLLDIYREFETPRANFAPSVNPRTPSSERPLPTR